MKEVEKRDKNVQLIIAGKGDDEKEIKALARKLKLKNVKFIGYVADDELVKVYNSCDAFISASPNEPFGITFLEAMACGKPVIAINNAGPKEIVTKKTGFLVERENLVETILRLRDFDLEEMGRKARERVMKYFTWDIVAERLIKIYNKL